MKKYRLYFLAAFMIIISSCSSTKKLPVSSVVPAAEITVTESMDKNNNYEIVVKAKNLASPERLNPPKSYYVVWGTTEQGIKNLGQLVNKNARKAELKTLTPFKVSEIFITAEKQGNVSSPGGIEISRAILE